LLFELLPPASLWQQFLWNILAEHFSYDP
jgi:hypothetical protein